MTKKLYTGYNEYENIHEFMKFDIVDKIPAVGDWWESTCEVIKVDEVQLDDIENDKAYPDRFKAYRVEYINRGFEDEEPFVDFVAVKIN